MAAAVVLYDPLKARFKARPGYARGWSRRLEHALFYPSKEAASADADSDRLKSLNVYLVEDDIDNELEPLIGT